MSKKFFTGKFLIILFLVIFLIIQNIQYFFDSFSKSPNQTSSNGSQSTRVKLTDVGKDYVLMHSGTKIKPETVSLSGQIFIEGNGKKLLLSDGNDGDKKFVQASKDRRFISYWDSPPYSGKKYRLKMYDLDEGFFLDSTWDNVGNYLPIMIYPDVYCASWSSGSDSEVYTFVVQDISPATFVSNDIVFYKFEPITNRNFDGVDPLTHGKEIILRSGESGANFGKDTYKISSDCKHIAYFESFPTETSMKSGEGLDIRVTKFIIEDPYSYEKWTFEIPQIVMDKFKYEWISTTELELTEGEKKVKIVFDEEKREFRIDRP